MLCIHSNTSTTEIQTLQLTNTREVEGECFVAKNEKSPKSKIYLYWLAGCSLRLLLNPQPNKCKQKPLMPNQPTHSKKNYYIG